MKKLFFLFFFLVSTVYGGPQSKTVKYLLDQGVTLAEAEAGFSVISRGNQDPVFLDWSWPLIPEPTPALLDSISEAEAQAQIKAARQSEKPAKLQASENRLVLQARADAVIGPTDVTVTSEQIQQKIDELLDNNPTPANDSLIARYLALQSSLTLAGGTIDDAVLVETP